ncbi:MAG: TauD/TfdA family dioxygenase [Rhodospirillales bacterium]
MTTLADDLQTRRTGERFGAEITGIDLSEPASDDLFSRIEATLNRYSVVVIRDQKLSGEQLVAFSRRFGPLQVNVRAEANNGEAPEIYWISNITKDGKPVGSHDAGRYWHSDLCYLEKPSRATLLNAIEVPEKDGKVYGDTCFISVADAYDALSDEMKQRLASLRAANGYRFMWNKKALEFGLRPVLSEKELEKYPPDAIHPVVRTHPHTGRKCLYVCEGYTHRILDLPEAESDELLQQLFAHITQSDFAHNHNWRVGDLLIWDNCAVQHKATNDFQLPLRRLMQRCTVEGSTPY